MNQPAFIYVSLLRTASRSLRTTLFPDCPTSAEPPCYWNLTAAEIRSDFEERGWDWDSCFKFSVVRNPWDRLVSAYHFWKPQQGQILGADEPGAQPLSFDAWIQHLVIQDDSASKLLLQQCPLLTDASGAMLIDSVIPFDQLQQRWPWLQRQCQVTTALPSTHRTVHRHYSHYYTTATRALVATACSEDIDRFGFRFDRLGRRAEILDRSQYYLAWAKASAIGRMRVGFKRARSS